MNLFLIMKGQLFFKITSIKILTTFKDFKDLVLMEKTGIVILMQTLILYIYSINRFITITIRIPIILLVILVLILEN